MTDRDNLKYSNREMIKEGMSDEEKEMWKHKDTRGYVEKHIAGGKDIKGDKNLEIQPGTAQIDPIKDIKLDLSQSQANMLVGMVG
ncbi:hypothetical protein HDU76_000210 [Blyttiomyces sp. JEL0837]|nr:hypothetical protein HDU76_000210 [Blyttiomyces sp. JEL0837]